VSASLRPRIDRTDFAIVSGASALPAARDTAPGVWQAGEAPRITRLEDALETIRAELQGAIRELGCVTEALRALHRGAIADRAALPSWHVALPFLDSRWPKAPERILILSNEPRNLRGGAGVTIPFLDWPLRLHLHLPAPRDPMAGIGQARAVTLGDAIARAMAPTRDLRPLADPRQAATDRLTRLTGRQREVMERVLAGEPSKNIAADLGISQRTVETHRAQIRRRTGAKSLPALARLAMAAASGAG